MTRKTQDYIIIRTPYLVMVLLVFSERRRRLSQGEMFMISDDMPSFKPANRSPKAKRFFSCLNNIYTQHGITTTIARYLSFANCQQPGTSDKAKSLITQR
ncbi:hypothetical protein I8F96_14525 [Enterococcus casseliflavus]|nr:hypothetical protein [Enterococcus casseliflavus]